MNKILLSSVVISATLLMACSKNEAPEDSMQEEVSSPISEPLEVLGSSAVTAVEITREQTANTITEQRKEYQSQIETSNNGQNTEASSEDDAVAAALAAANPAINNSYSTTPSNSTNNATTNTETQPQQQ